MRSLTIWTVAFLLVFVHTSTQADEPTPKIVPGRAITLEFPKLPKMRDGKLTKMQVRVPSSYDPKKSYPLIAWMGGGKGGYSVGTGSRLADPNQFIMIGLPYPEGANNPGQANMVGKFDVIWAYHKAMLDRLEQVIPNINPELRVVAGFSNGGHAIDGMLGVRSRQLPPYGSYFTTFILADGGSAVGDYRSIRGRHLFICWGVKGATNKGSCESIAKRAKSSGVYVQAMAMTDTGHQFPDKYQKLANTWLAKTVIPHTVAMGTRNLSSMIRRRKYADAIKVGRGLIELGADEKQTAQIEKSLADIDAKGNTAFAALKIYPTQEMSAIARKSAARRVIAFVKLWEGTAAGQQGKELLEQLTKE